jgi:hypothetical protein
MKQISKDQPVQEHKKGNPPKYLNKIEYTKTKMPRRLRKLRVTKYKNDRVPLGSGVFMIGKWQDSTKAIFQPKRTKFKGWMRKAS